MDCRQPDRLLIRKEVRHLPKGGRLFFAKSYSTRKCNYRCRHCLVSAPNAHHPQLPLQDFLHIIREIAVCGINRVDITGGEPFLRSDFEEIVKELSSFNIDIGTVFTNASLLTEDVLQMLKKYHQYPAFQLSFDGLGHHDWLRGVEGAELEADKAFRLLQKHELQPNMEKSKAGVTNGTVLLS